MADIEAGQVIFYSECTPPLPSGNYALKLEQTVTLRVNGTTETLSLGTAVEQHFGVDGPRDRLAPAEIHSVSPPEQSDGPFQSVLPHVTLCRRTLPWERSTNGDGTAPWLAVILLTGTEKSNMERQGDGRSIEQEHDGVRILELPQVHFDLIGPLESELKSLCHVRRVSLEDKAMLGHDVDGWFSVVVCNRLPKAGDWNHAYLVSLEGKSKELPQLQGAERAVRTDGTVNLIVLHSWSFRCAQGRDFKGLMKHLNVGMLGTINQRQTGGFTHLEHHTLEGEVGMARYRGPLVPMPLAPDHRGPYFVSDQARGFNPATNEENLGYAAAFELGRLLAISSFPFCSDLLRYRRTVARQLRATSEERAQQALIEGPQPPSSSASSGIGPTRPLDGYLEGRARSVLWSAGRDAPEARRTLASVNQNMLLTARASAIPGSLLRWRPAFGPLHSVESPGSAPATVPPPSATLGSSTRRKQRVDSFSKQLTNLQSEVYGDQDFIDQVIQRLEPPPQSLMSWLAQLRLLEGVPFDYLVPDVRMLPPESIRFFYLDPSWSDRLMEGALSVGRAGTRELRVLQLLYRRARGMAITQEAQIRPSRLKSRLHKGAKLSRQSQAGNERTARTGFLLRSNAVLGWPGLEVVGYEDEQAKQVLPLLRMERLAGDVLLCIFGGTPARIDLREPGEGIQFGVNEALAPFWWRESTFIRALNIQELAEGKGSNALAEKLLHPLAVQTFVGTKDFRGA